MKSNIESLTERGVISPYQLFFVFLVSRGVVALTFYQSILHNGITPDSIISLILAIAINAVFCIPAYLCVKNNSSPVRFRTGRVIYLLYFVFFSGVNIARFAFFACDKTTHGDSAVLFIILMSAAACYAAFLGIEAIGRFSVICAAVSIILLAVITLLNVKNFHLFNFLPFFVGTKYQTLQNSLVFSSNSVEPALFLFLSKRCKDDSAKPLFFGVFASYFAALIMLVFCIGVLGTATSLFSYPVFTLFQMTAFKSFSRLDIVYTAFGFFALFAKCSVLVYCSSQCVKPMKQKTKAILLFAVTGVVSFLIYKQFYSETIGNARWFYTAVSIAFSFIIPLIFLISKRSKENEEKI